MATGNDAASINNGSKPTKRKQGSSTIVKSQQKSTSGTSTVLPASFSPAPSNLKSFLDVLDKRRVYITHIDIHPGWFKRRVFAIPVVLNVVIAVLLAWRLRAALPWYFDVIRNMFERPADIGEHLLGAELIRRKESASWMEFASVVLKRAGFFALDYMLVTIVAPWPWSFFLEAPGNPFKWRSVVRFRDQEAIVRISRSFGADELVGGIKKGADSAYFRTRVAPAIGREVWMKTGYLLMDKDWDLDFAAMVWAHGCVDDEVMTLKDLDKKIFVFHPPPAPDANPKDEFEGQWLVYDVPRPAEEQAAEEYLNYQGSDEGKRKILEMRQRLASMGKEELFFKWVDLVQKEVEKPGGFTKERQLEAGLKVQALFEEYSVDWEQFADQVGLET